MVEIISDVQIENYFNSLQEWLLSHTNRVAFQPQRRSYKSFPKKAGVYCFFINDTLAYVGETGCLSKRLADLLDTRNHTLRRTIGDMFFNNEAGYIKANSRKKYPSHIEEKLEEWMIDHLKFSFVPVKIGRKEFEEWLQYSNPNTKFLNKRTKRK